MYWSLNLRTTKTRQYRKCAQDQSQKDKTMRPVDEDDCFQMDVTMITAIEGSVAE